MPVVRISLMEGRTHAQKQELARVITEAIVNIAQTTAEATTIIFEDVARTDWATAGTLASDK